MIALAVYGDGGRHGLADVMSALHLGWAEVEIEQVQDCELVPDALAARAPDLIIVSVSTSGDSWLTLVRRIRQKTSAVIAVVSTEYNEADLIEAVDSGADIFMGLPLSLTSFVARVRALLRRIGSETGGSQEVVCGDLTVDAERHEVRLHGRFLHLTPTEFEILLCLTQRGDRISSKELLCAGIWHDRRILDETTLRKHIHQLRRKLNAVPESGASIVTIAGVGHKLVYTDTVRSELMSAG